MIFGTHDIIAQKKIVKNIFTFPQKTSFVFFVLLALSLGFYVSADEQNDSREYSLFRDADQDGLSDEEEKVFGTDPFVRDTDGDSYSDGVEVESGYDPLRPAPGDKLTDDFRIGDLIQAKVTKVMGVDNADLTTAENELGVLKAMCTNCRHFMNKIGKKEVKCPNCGRKETRNISSNYEG